GRFAVIGGGVIGMEFASFFSSFGVEVHVIEMLDEILPTMDGDLSKLMRREMKGAVEFHLGSKVVSIDGGKVTYETGGETESLEADIVLMSVGRRPNVKNNGFEKIGLDFTPKGVVVDEKMRTNLPGIYAVGDVNGKSLLAHSASRMGDVAAAVISGDDDRMRYHAIPWVVYTQPEAAGTGLTEAEAEAKGITVKSASLPLRANGRFLAENGNKSGICKVVTAADTGVLLGVHLLGGVSSEIIYGASAMIEAELRVKDIREVVFPHPTMAEIIKDTLWEL
ncbi:MAG: dihydrolipoyl dehydrogenase family protein, partial [bacterium]